MIHPEHQKAIDLVKEGKPQKALAILNTLIQAEPGNAYFYSERGVVYYHLQEPEKSIADMNKAAELQPDSPYRYSSRAYIRDWIGDLHGAIADYEKAIALDPDDVIAINNLGMLQEKLGYKEKARDYYKRADKLAGIEQSFHEQIDETEGPKKPQPAQPKTPDPVQEEKQSSLWKEMTKVFKDKKERKEFFQFIKNGFKINKDDQKRES